MNPLSQQQEAFDEEFKCIQSDCDGNGNIPHQIAEGEWEAQQCQFHAEYLFPIKAFLLASNKAVLSSVLEKVKELKTANKNTLAESDDYQQALQEIATIIKDVIAGKV